MTEDTEIILLRLNALVNAIKRTEISCKFMDETLLLMKDIYKLSDEDMSTVMCDNLMCELTELFSDVLVEIESPPKDTRLRRILGRFKWFEV